MERPVQMLNLCSFDVQRDVPFVSQVPTRKSDTQAKDMEIREEKKMKQRDN